ncbi:MAG: hypothetical protein HIU93_08390 [Acidobacteria bacterium]|nr:hypothetical protein [Acidobacteriota bacterium]MBW4045589.1 hypothetical protein [Acidobacteriota bacterium]
MKARNAPDDVGSLTRRGFAGSLFGAATVALLPVASVAQSKSTDEPGPRPEDLSDADWNEVRARYSNLLRVYGERLSLEEKPRLAAILTTNQRMLASVRSFVVQNGDPSACTLRLYSSHQHDSATGSI